MSPSRKRSEVEVDAGAKLVAGYLAPPGGAAQVSKEREQEVMAALRHPVRRELLRLCYARGEVTVREAARTLRHPPDTLRYHIKTLSNYGVLKQLNTKLVKGSRSRCWGVAPAVVETNWICEALNLRAST